MKIRAAGRRSRTSKSGRLGVVRIQVVPLAPIYGQRSYTFARQGRRFLVLDSTDFHSEQGAWIENALKADPEEWA